MNFSQYVDKFFWLLMAFFANSIVNEANSINQNIKVLNEKMATLVANVGSQEKRMDALDYRISNIEAQRFRK